MTYHMNQVNGRNVAKFNQNSFDSFTSSANSSSTNCSGNFELDLRNLVVSPSGTFTIQASMPWTDQDLVNDRSMSGMRPRGAPFPVKLYYVASAEDDLVCWTSDGTGIYVPDIEKFEEEVMERFIGFVQIPTFLNLRRQLRQYGFDWSTDKLRKRLVFTHLCFLRGHHELLEYVVTRRRQDRKPRRKDITRTLENHKYTGGPIHTSLPLPVLKNSSQKNDTKTPKNSKVKNLTNSPGDVGQVCDGPGTLANDTEWVPCCIKYMGHLYYFDECQIGCQCADPTPPSPPMEVKFWQDSDNLSQNSLVESEIVNVKTVEQAEADLAQEHESLARQWSAEDGMLQEQPAPQTMAPYAYWQQPYSSPVHDIYNQQLQQGPRYQHALPQFIPQISCVLSPIASSTSRSSSRSSINSNPSVKSLSSSMESGPQIHSHTTVNVSVKTESDTMLVDQDEARFNTQGPNQFLIQPTASLQPIFIDGANLTRTS